MTVAPLVLFTAMALAPAEEPGPAALVAKLGSAWLADRTEAADALKALGRGALPALQKALKADDADLRERASALWEAIQRELMTRPSMVRLAGRDRTLTAVLGDLEAQTGLKLRVNQAPREDLAAPVDPAPVPFWTALERLGVGGIYAQNPADGKTTRLDLREAPGWASASTAGPFRVSLTGLHLHRDRQLIRGPWVRVDGFGQRINVPGDELKGESVIFFGDLAILVEPRMWFTLEAPARLIEAVDDLGQSLVSEAAGAETTSISHVHFAVRSGSGVTQATAEFRLRPPEKPGRIARLRGVVPVMLHLRRPEPMLVIPLSGAAGKTFRCDDAEFAIQTVDDSPTATGVSLSVTLNIDRADLPAPPARELMMSRLQVMAGHQFELVDASGAVVADSISSGSGGGDTPAVYRWTMHTRQNGRATHFRYYGMLRARFEAAFDFRDVPLP